MAYEEVEPLEGTSSCTTSSPTSTLHCYQLECAVKIASTASNEVRGSIQSKHAFVTLGRNVRRQIILQIEPTNVKGVSHISYLLQHCNIHGRMIKSGCGSIEIPAKQTVIFLSNCPPRRLNVFLKTLDAKLALLTGSNENNLLRTPPLSVIRREMLNGLPNVFEKLSPLAVEEIRALRRLRNKNKDVTASPSLKCVKNVDKEVTPKLAAKRRPLRDLQQTPSSTDFVSPKQKKLKAIESLTVQLTDEQKGVVRAVVERKKSVFFTGSAGTGKSLVLRTIIDLLPAGTTFVTASTGVAACFIGGITLHSFAGIGCGSGSKEQCVELAKRKPIEQQWKRCQRLVIDEISMIDANYFEKLEHVAREIRNNSEPFGGIQLIITGDFLQLPPVTKGGDKPKFCFMSEAWRRCISETFLLCEVKRQTDNAFVEVLQEVRTGKCSSKVVSQLNATRRLDFEASGIVPTRLCTHTADVDLINKQQLDALEGEERIFTAKDNFFVPETRKLNILKRLVLKVGAQVMLMKNLDLHRGLSNGSRGVVKAFSSRGFPVVRFVAFESNEVEIAPIKFQFRVPDFETPLLRLQLPLQLAWAISIHKSQGLTLDAVEISLSRVFADGQAYVALSRARTLESLRLVGFDPASIRANSAVVDYYERLKKRASSTFSRSRVALFHKKPNSAVF